MVFFYGKNSLILTTRCVLRDLQRLPLLVHSGCQINQVRTVIMAPSTKSMKRVKRRPTRNNNEQANDLKKKIQSKILSQKIRKLQELSKNLKAEIKAQDEKKLQKEVEHINEPVTAQDDDDELIFNELIVGDVDNRNINLLSDKSMDGGDQSVQLFNQPANGVRFPPPVIEKLGDSIKYLASIEHQNWNRVIETLQSERNGFKGLSAADISGFVHQIPNRSLTLESVDILIHLLKESGIKYNITIYDSLMKQLAHLSQTERVQNLMDEALASGLNPSKHMFGHLIKAYSKTKNAKEINLILKNMLNRGMEPSLVIYTNILKLCVSLNDVEQADSIFQMLKFRSLQTKPDIQSYNTMLELCGRSNNILKALNLYQELLTEGLQPNVYTFENLAKVCSKSKKHILKGWDFIIEIYKRGLEPTVKTFEVMLRLSAKDGDLELARSIYLKIAELDSNSVDIDPFIYLMMSYRDFRFDHRPLILSHEEASNIRSNIIGLVDFVGYHDKFIDDPAVNKRRENCPPFLPLRRLATKRQIIAESNAIWSFQLMRSPRSLQTSTLCAYLSCSITHGDKEEYKRRLEDFSYPDDDINHGRVIIESAEDTVNEVPEGDIGDTEQQQTSLSPAYEHVRKANPKIVRTTEIYVNMMAAGRRFKNIELCEMAWKERGLYRKTPRYQSLSKNLRMEYDFRFAREMVLAFTELDLIYDATKIVKSTQNQFDWSYYALKPLHLKLVEIGDAKTASEISKICGTTKVIKNY